MKQPDVGVGVWVWVGDCVGVLVCVGDWVGVLVGSMAHIDPGPTIDTYGLAELTLSCLAQIVLVVKLTTEVVVIIPEQLVYVKS